MITNRPTISVILEKRKKLKSGKHPVKLRVYHQGERHYYTLPGHSYTQNEYNKAMSSGAKGKFKKIQIELRTYENDAIQYANKIDPFSVKTFKQGFIENAKPPESIDDYFQQKVEQLEEDKKLQSAGTYNAALRSFKTFDSNFSFSWLSTRNVQRYINKKIEEEKTFSTYLKNLKHILGRARKNGVVFEDPFEEIKIPNSNTWKRALSKYELKTLWQYEPISTEEEKALDYWFLSYLCNGMNQLDIAHLTSENLQGNHIVFKRRKTRTTSKEQTEIKIKIEPEIQSLMEKLGEPNKQSGYIFPILFPGFSALKQKYAVMNHNKMIARHLKRISKKLELSIEVTAYAARHTFSSMLMADAPLEYIRQSLGHQSLKTTQVYLGSFDDEKAGEYRKSLIPSNLDFES